ncbi:MAG: hypothetical protein J4432_01010 [DPANN group archaeon]|nr:hypothetical protein [DPANN group archaeon]
MTRTKNQNHKRGFIGPIGDDLPSIIAIMLALTLFFSGLSFALDAYNQKVNSIRIFKGSLEIAKVFVSDGLVIQDELGALKETAKFPAATYGLNFDAGFPSADFSPQADCSGQDLNYIYSYLVTRETPQSLIPDIFYVCVGVKK